jgi:hypothetical protein
VKLLKGKRLKSVTFAWIQPYFGLVHFLADGPASMLFAGEGVRECGSFGSVIAFIRMRGAIWSDTARFRVVLVLAYNGFKRPVLKHGPRSLTCLRVFGWKTRARNESE